VPAGGTTMQVGAEIAEGGNFIDVRYGPLMATGNYHIDTISPAINTCNFGPPAGVGYDFDKESRPPSQPDWGADEVPNPLMGVVSYSSGAFGNVLVDTTATMTITATVSVAPVTFISSTDPVAPFAKIADNCAGLTLNPGETCTFEVSFSPTMGITSSGSFDVTSDALCSPQIVELSGSGVGGTVTFSSGAFGYVPIGTTATMDITATVSVAPITFISSTDPAAPFAKIADTCSGTTVPIGGTCTFTVTYSPTAGNTSNGSFTVFDDALINPQIVQLSGNGVRGTVAYSSGAFGNVALDTTMTMDITATVSNYAVTFASSTDPQAPFGKIADNCAGTTVPVGGSCTFTVTFSPTSPQTYNGSFTVTSNASATPETVILSGTGVRQVAFTGQITTPNPQATLTPSAVGGTLDFGNRNQNQSPASTLTITVSGNTPVTFGSLAVATQAPYTNFTKGGDTCSGATIAPGSTCTVAVIYAGTAGNNGRQGTLTVPHNGTGSPTLVLQITGN